jgi:hypothetical protein
VSYGDRNSPCKYGSEFRSEEFPCSSLTPDRSKTATLAPTSEYLAQSNKSLRRDQATRSREPIPAARRNFAVQAKLTNGQRCRLLHDRVRYDCRRETLAPAGSGVSKSAASRHFVALSAARMPPSLCQAAAIRGAGLQEVGDIFRLRSWMRLVHRSLL